MNKAENWIRAIIAVLSALLGVLGGSALQCFSIGAINKFINNEAEERISADNTLQSNLNTEAEIRINEDNNILSKLKEETDEIWTHINSVSENVYTKSEIDGITGYIKTALDSIIAIQNRLMGVSE